MSLLPLLVITEVIVLPEQSVLIESENTKNSQGVFSEAPDFKSRFQRKKSVIENRSLGSPFQDIKKIKDNPEVQQSSTPTELMADAGPSSTMLHGGENGLVLMRLRGARSHSPVFYLGKVPLSGFLRGESALHYLPSQFYSSINSYPYGLSEDIISHTLSGVVQLQPCTYSQCMGKQGVQHAEVGAGFGGQKTQRYHLNLGVKKKLLLHGEYSRSQNDYSYSQIVDEELGTTRDLNVKNRDYKRSSFGFSLFPISHSFLGRVSLWGVASQHEQGLGSLVENPQEGFQESWHLFSALSVEQNKINPMTGAKTNSSLSLRHERQEVSAKSGKLKESENSALFFSVTHWLGLSEKPYSVGLNLGASWERVDFEDLSSEESLKVEALSSRFGSLLQFKNIFGKEWLSVNTDNFLTMSSTHIQKDCFETGCQKDSSENQVFFDGNSISLNGNFENVLTYLRFVHLQRAPWVVELAGDLQGIVENTNLKREKAYRLELGFETAFINTILYYGIEKDLILPVTLNPSVQQYQNIEEARKVGVNISAALQFLSDFKLSSELHLLLAEIKQDEDWKKQPHTSLLSLKSQLNYLYKTGKYTFQPFIAAQYWSRYALNPDNTLWLYPDPTVNIGGSLNFKVDKINFTTNFKLENILNSQGGKTLNSSQKTQSVSHTGYSTLPAKGRHFLISFTVGY